MSKRPTPTELKKDKGTFRADRSNPNEIKLHGDTILKTPPCPQHFNKWARKEWGVIWKFMASHKLAGPADMAMAAAYCMEVGTYLEAKMAIKEEGLTVINDKGVQFPNANIKIANTALDNARKLATEYGFTPSSRTKIAPVGGKKKSKIQDILDKKAEQNRAK